MMDFRIVNLFYFRFFSSMQYQTGKPNPGDVNFETKIIFHPANNNNFKSLTNFIFLSFLSFAFNIPLNGINIAWEKLPFFLYSIIKYVPQKGRRINYFPS